MARRDVFIDKQIERLTTRINCVERNIENLREAIGIVDFDDSKVVTLHVINHHGDRIPFFVTKNTVAHACDLEEGLAKINNEMWLRLARYINHFKKNYK